MKKIITMILIVSVLGVCAFAFAACGKEAAGKYVLYAPDGAPVLALADMWGENVGDAEFEYGVIAETEVRKKMASGNADFIVAPVNVGAEIHSAYERGKTPYDYKLLNVTSWGVIYFTTNQDGYKTREECETVNEFLLQFEGKSVSTIGRAAIPGKTVEYLFDYAGAEVTLNGSEAAAIKQSYATGADMTAIFAEPAITAVNGATGNSVTVLASVSDIYKEVTGKDFPMSGLFVRADVLENDAKTTEAVDKRTESSVAEFNDNIDEVSVKAEEIDGFTLTAAAIKNAYTKMNVRYKNADGSKADVETLLGHIGASCDDSLFA